MEIDERNQWVRFNPMAANHFRRELLVLALQDAMLCSTTRPGTYVMGMANDRHSDILQAYKLSPTARSAIVNELDRAMDIDSDGNYTGDLDVPPLSRKAGIGFERRDVMGEADRAFWADTPRCLPIRPDDDAPEEVRARYEQNMTDRKARRKELMESLSQPYEVIRDLDWWSAAQQHAACGLPVDDAVQTESVIMERLRQTSSITFQIHKYPDAFIRDADRERGIARSKSSRFAVALRTSILSQRAQDLNIERRRRC
jgi:hypothetical protein